MIGASDATPASWILGLSAVASGCLLLAGFLTPLAGVIAALNVVGTSLSARAAAPIVFDSRLAFVFALTILLAVIGAGPGRYSVDARMFGRREIIIPLPHSSLER